MEKLRLYTCSAIIYLCITFLLSSCEILGFSPGEQNISLSKTMVTLDGQKVDAIQLGRGESAILAFRDKKDSTSAVHSEIRKDKTIRLGGYFYKGYEKAGHLSKGQIKWIAQNLDLLSINEYAYPEQFGKRITPEEVKEIKKINSKFRFYMMVYGTTMIEPVFDPTRMSSWTLKHKSGSEAIGLRRASKSSSKHIMDLKNYNYAKFLGQYITEHTKKYGADGVAIDEIMWEGYWDVKTDDIVGYNSESDYYNASLNFIKRVSKFSSTDIIHQAYWNEAQRYSNGVWGESAFKFHYSRSKKEVFYREMNYEDIIDNLFKISSRGDSYIWAAWYRKNNKKDLKYAIATYLMGKGSNSAIFQLQPFDEDLKKRKAYDFEVFEEEYKKYKEYLGVEMGNPMERAERVSNGNVWKRKYKKGVVFSYPKK